MGSRMTPNGRHWNRLANKYSFIMSCLKIVSMLFTDNFPTFWCLVCCQKVNIFRVTILLKMSKCPVCRDFETCLGCERRRVFVFRLRSYLRCKDRLWSAACVKSAWFTIRVVNIGFFCKPIIGFRNPILNRLSFSKPIIGFPIIV